MSIITANPNLIFVTLEQVGRMILLAFFCDIPIALWGAPGIGKSAKVYQVAAIVGWKLYDFRLSDKEASDIAGIPSPIYPQDIPGESLQATKVRVKPFVEYLIAQGILPFGTHELDADGKWVCLDPDHEDYDLHCRGCERCILFIDEVDRTDNPAVKNAIQQVILDRHVNGHFLSKYCRIVMAGNGTSDIDTSQLSKAANGRMVHAYIENVSMGALDSWIGWAETEIEHPEFGPTTNASPMLRAFAKFNHAVFTNGQASEETKLAEQAEATNRTWIYADTFIRAADRVEFRTADILKPLVAGCVGQKAATELLGFRSYFDNAPTIEAILADPEKVEVPERPDVRLALTYSLTDQATRDLAIAEAVATYGLRWPEEPAAFLFRRLLEKQPSVATTDPFQQWSHKRLRHAPTATVPSYVNHLPELARIFTGSKPLPENDQWVNRLQIPSKSNPGKSHILSQNRKDKTWACSCPGWINRRTCDHTKRVPVSMQSPQTSPV